MEVHRSEFDHAAYSPSGFAASLELELAKVSAESLE